MNWKMNTLNVRLSSKSDCVRCISEIRSAYNWIPMHASMHFSIHYKICYWVQYQNCGPPTPFGETLGHVLIEAAHCHNRHQIDLRKLGILNTDLRNIRNQIFKEHWSAEIEVRFYQIESFSSNSTLFPHRTVFTSSLWRHAVKPNLAWQGGGNFKVLWKSLEKISGVFFHCKNQWK